MPRKLDSEGRQRICSLIRVGVTKLLNKKIISFFEETNEYAENVACSPPPSPSRSLVTEDAGKKPKHKQRSQSIDVVLDSSRRSKLNSFMSDLSETEVESSFSPSMSLNQPTFAAMSAKSSGDSESPRLQPVKSLSSNSLMELAALSEGVPYKVSR